MAGRRSWSLTRILPFAFIFYGLVLSFGSIYLALLAYALLEGLYYTVPLPLFVVNMHLDGYLAGALLFTALAALVILKRKPIQLFFVEVVIAVMSAVLASVRLKIPVNMYVDYTTMTTVYIYDINIFALLYAAPATISLAGAIVAIMETIGDLFHHKTRSTIPLK